MINFIQFYLEIWQTEFEATNFRLLLLSFLFIDDDLENYEIYMDWKPKHNIFEINIQFSKLSDKAKHLVFLPC